MNFIMFYVIYDDSNYENIGGIKCKSTKVNMKGQSTLSRYAVTIIFIMLIILYLRKN